MKPTQAQIGVAGSMQALESIAGWADVDLRNESRDELLKVIQSMANCAKAALTAAAEVEPMASLADEKLVNSPNARAAAAEVSVPKYGAWGDLTAAAGVGEQIYTQSQCNSMVKQTWSATIERCAQVAENYPRCYDPRDNELIATAIRALKDQP